MIDEAELRQLLEEAATYFEVPADGQTRVMAAATAPAEPKRRSPLRRLPRLGAIGAVAVLIAVGGIFVLGTMVGSRNTSPKTASARQPGGSGLAIPYTSGGSAGAAGGSASDAGAAGGLGVARAAQPVPAPAPSDTAKVVKTGSVAIEVRKGAVGPTITRLTGLATGLGGYVSETKTAEDADNPTGSATLRVPVSTFENLVASVRALGTVKSVTTHGQDVTAQYVDIQARLNASKATLDQLYTIMRRATAVGDILAVQDQINQTQTNIDQLQGQLNVLNDQASYAALAVDVAQHGSAAPGPPATKVGLAKALDDGRHGFTHGVEWIIAHSGTALLLLLIAAVVAVVIRLGWPRVRRRFV
jgi:Domain of unknown function (DUF4349)